MQRTDLANPNPPSFAMAATLFIAGFGLFMLCRRSDFLPYVPWMIVLAPILILRFSRILPVWRSILLTTLGFIVAFNIALWGVFDVGDPVMTAVVNLIRNSMIALLYTIPYWIDRIVTPRLGAGLQRTLVFPAAVTALMFLASLAPPLNGTQAKNVFATAPAPLIQVYALAGLWGFVFLWSWLAACLNHIWEHRPDRRPMAVTAAALVLVFGGLTVWGGLRMTTETEGPTARLAAIVMPAEEGGPQSMVEVFDNRLTSPYDQTIARIEAMVAEAAGTGAEIVSLSEFAIVVNESDNARARAAFVRIASENGVWLSVPYAWIPEEGKGENRHLLISDTGEILLDYQKRYLQGLGDMGETAVFVRGPTVVQWADTPFGRIAVAICKDASFPRFFLQAGQAGVDIMLVGSHEFPRGLYLNDPYRAVENGFTHVRTTYDGFTYAMDPFGRVLAQMNRGVGEAGIMYVDVPTQGVGTLYARFGDWLGWGSVGLTVVLILAAAVFGRGPGPVAEARGIH